MARKVSFAKLDTGWGIRVDDFPVVNVAPGDQVDVAKRDGTTKQVTVARVVDRFNGGTSAYCEIVNDRKNGNGRNGNGNGSRRRPGTISLSLAVEQLDALNDLLGSYKRIVVEAQSQDDESLVAMVDGRRYHVLVDGTVNELESGPVAA